MGDSDVHWCLYERRVEELKFSLCTTYEEIHNYVDTGFFQVSCVLIQDYCDEVWLKRWFKELTKKLIEKRLEMGNVRVGEIEMELILREFHLTWTCWSHSLGKLK